MVEDVERGRVLVVAIVLEFESFLAWRGFSIASVRGSSFGVWIGGVEDACGVAIAGERVGWRRIGVLVWCVLARRGDC